MNILIVVHRYPPSVGGIQTAAFSYAENFRNNFNHNVVVLTRKIPEARETYKNENGIHVFRIKSLGSNIFTKFIPQIQNFGIEPY